MKSHCLINLLKSRKPIQTHLKTTCRFIVFRCSAWQKAIFWNDIRHFEWKTPSRFNHFQTQCFGKKNTFQKTSKRLGVLHSKLHFLTQFFTAIMIFDARTPINALPNPLSIFLKIPTLPQTICFRSPNAQNWYTHCSNAYKIIDFEWKTPSRFHHFQTQCFFQKNTLQKTWKRFGVFHSKLHFCVQSFQKVLIFDTRTPINVLPKPLSIF